MAPQGPVWRISACRGLYQCLAITVPFVTLIPIVDEEIEVFERSRDREHAACSWCVAGLTLESRGSKGASQCPAGELGRSQLHTLPPHPRKAPWNRKLAACQVPGAPRVLEPCPPLSPLPIPRAKA